MVRFEICGNLGRDPRAFGQGQQQSVRFPVAHTFPSFTTDRGQLVPETTTWLDILCWGSLARVALQYLHKGDKVYVSGTIRTREIVDQNGQRRFFTDYEAREIEFMSKPSAAAATAATPNAQQASTAAPQATDDRNAAEPNPATSAAHQTQAAAATTEFPFSDAAAATLDDYPFPPL